VLGSESALFEDLFSNMLGSWIIGFMANGASLGVGKIPWAAFPHNSIQQDNVALQLGIRTGFCGSLTT
jgi:fluoride ion exporter CrcB/FEX